MYYREIEEVINQLLKQCASAKEIATSSKPAAPIEYALHIYVLLYSNC